MELIPAVLLLDLTRRHFAVREGDAFKIADMQVQTSRMPKWSPHSIVRPNPATHCGGLILLSSLAAAGGIEPFAIHRSISGCIGSMSFSVKRP